jgi:hypothetical protein
MDFNLSTSTDDATGALLVAMNVNGELDSATAERLAGVRIFPDRGSSVPRPNGGPTLLPQQ